MYAQPHMPLVTEQNTIKRDGHYIGTLMLALLVALELTFTVVVFALALVGVIDVRMLSQEYLGLDNTTYLLVYVAVYSFVFLAPTVIVSLCFRRNPLPFTPRQRIRALDAFLSPLVAVALCILISVMVSVAMSYLAEFGVPMPDLPSMLENTPTSYGLNILVMAVLPALWEELMFRGCVLRTLRAYGDWFAVVVSSVLFGLMHGNIIQIPFALAVGMVLGWLYVKTENIWIPITVHFANNALSVSMEYAMMQLDETGQNIFAVLTYILVIGAGLVSFIVMYVQKSDVLSGVPKVSTLSFTDRCKALLSSPPLLIALIAFVIILIVGML